MIPRDTRPMARPDVGEAFMKRTVASTTALAALLATTTLAHAGGVERQGQSTSILFEEGTYLEFGLTFVNPDVSGSQLLPAPGAPAGSLSGDISPAFSFGTFSFRADINDDWSFALIYDQPIGADVNYGPNGGIGYLFGTGLGSQAEVRSDALTAALRYEINDRVSAYGGLRAVSARGNVQLFNGSGPAIAPLGSRYVLDASSDTEIGYLLGAAYEIPDIALRVALTYYSETDLSFTGVEGFTTPTDVTLTAPTAFDTTVPQQVLLEAQSGVAEGTLVFGSIRWVDWSEFTIAPPAFTASAGAPLASFQEDTITYTIGGARVLSDNWTALGSITYEPSTDALMGNLSPVDGRTSLSLGARYTQGSLTVTGGVNYSMLGDAQTVAPSGFPEGAAFGDFQDNDAISFGLRVGFSL